MKFTEAMGSADPEYAIGIHARFLLKWAWQPWVLTIATLVFVALAPGIDLRRLGLVWPDFTALGSLAARGGMASGAMMGVVVGVAAVLVGGVVVGVIAARRRAPDVAGQAEPPASRSGDGTVAQHRAALA